MLKLLIVVFLFCGFAGHTNPVTKIKTNLYSISWKPALVGSWEYVMANGKSVEIKLPVFEIDGKQTPAFLMSLEESGHPVTLRNGAKEYTFEGAFRQDASLHLLVRFRVADDNPVVRFSYLLKAAKGQQLTKKSGTDQLTYLSYSLKEFPEVKEICLSVFNEMIHSCNLEETQIYSSDFDHLASVAGPILIGCNSRNTFLCAYEHDSMYSNNFFQFQLNADKSIGLKAVKGNYFGNQPADGFSSVWFELAGVSGGESEMARQFRTFIRKYQSENLESRKPYLFYNTWGRQERVKWAGGTYLASMNLDYTLKEIDRAHEMGLEFYVFDAGWFDRTGDWGVNLKNFPDGFRQIREKLKAYGMKLGVWMNPEKAAISSQPFLKNKSCLKTIDGKPQKPSPEWETEESTNMCLVSPYWETYANVLIHLYNDLDIRYFYWDGVGQSGCNDPSHFHGTSENSPQERQQCYGYLLPVYLGKIAEKVYSVCPEAVFDFDVTEEGRIGVGLQFLASGRYFILNNGPYFKNFDLGESLLPNNNHNIFVQPGPARGWFIRSVLDYDQWIPSNLFLANYQPDDPRNSQLINIASLVLGPNSVWGEILKTSTQGVNLFNEILTKYKLVRNDVAAASPVHIGNSGDTPEIFEKINPETGKGAVVIFANGRGSFSYITKHRVNGILWKSEGSDVKIDAGGYARIEVSFNEASAAIVFFGVD
jgi:alpha-galactosidase